METVEPTQGDLDAANLILGLLRPPDPAQPRKIMLRVTRPNGVENGGMMHSILYDVLPLSHTSLHSIPPSASSRYESSLESTRSTAISSPASPSQMQQMSLHSQMGICHQRVELHLTNRIRVGPRPPVKPLQPCLIHTFLAQSRIPVYSLLFGSNESVCNLLLITSTGYILLFQLHPPWVTDLAHRAYPAAAPYVAAHVGLISSRLNPWIRMYR